MGVTARLASGLMFMGQRCTYQSMYDLPYLFFVLLRSSKSLSFTLGAFIIGSFVPKKQRISKSDLIYGAIVTTGLIIFNLEVAELAKRRMVKRTRIQ